MTTTKTPATESLATRDGYMRLAVFDGFYLVQPRADLAERNAYHGRHIGDGLPLRPSLLQLLAHMERCQLAQVWIHPDSVGTPASTAAALQAGLRPATPQPTHEEMDEARAAGWNVSRGADENQPWISAFHPGVWGRREIYWPALDKDNPYHDEPHGNAWFMALSLGRLTLALGRFWAKSPGGTAHALMVSTIGEKRRHYELDAVTMPQPAEQAGRHLDGAPVWLRDLLPHEQGWRYLVSLDRNGAWLSAAGMATLGIGAPLHVEGQAAQDTDWTRKDIAAALVKLGDYQPATLPDGMPDPLSAYRLRRQRGTGWVFLPMVRLLNEVGARYTAHEAYVWMSGARALEDWYTTLRNARQAMSDAGDTAALSMVKLAYTKGLGWLGHDGGDGWDRSQDALYRPDWYATIKSLSRANMYRAALKAASVSEYVPFAVSTDAWYYLVPWPTALANVTVKGRVVYPRGRSLADWKETVYSLDDPRYGGRIEQTIKMADKPWDARLSVLLQLLNLIDAGRFNG